MTAYTLLTSDEAENNIKNAIEWYRLPTPEVTRLFKQSGSAYLPRYYPPQLLHYLKTYGQDKVLFGGAAGIGIGRSILLLAGFFFYPS